MDREKELDEILESVLKISHFVINKPKKYKKTKDKIKSIRKKIARGYDIDEIDKEEDIL